MQLFITPIPISLKKTVVHYMRALTLKIYIEHYQQMRHQLLESRPLSRSSIPRIGLDPGGVVLQLFYQFRVRQVVSGADILRIGKKERSGLGFVKTHPQTEISVREANTLR